MSTVQPNIAFANHLYILPIILLVAGGTSSSRPIFDVLSCIILFMSASLIHFRVNHRCSSILHRRLMFFCFCLVSMIAVYIVPMPPFIWSNFIVDASTLNGRHTFQLEEAYFPLSLNYISTFYAICYSIFFTATYYIFYQFNSKTDKNFQSALIVVFFISLAISIFQIASNGANLNFYNSSHRGVGLGFFANRNHYALFCAYVFAFGAILISKFSIAPRRKLFFQVALASLTFTLALCTLSRIGIIINLAVLGIFFHEHVFNIFRNRKWAGVSVMLICILGIFWLSSIGKVGALFKRFGGAAEDERWIIWDKTASLIIDMFPFGAGPGVFKQYYMFKEDIETLKPTFVNHAHNEILEMIADFGVLVVPLAFLAIYYVIAVASSIRSSKIPIGREIYTLLGVVSLTLAHSIFDYPLRTMSIAILFAAALAYVHRNISHCQRLPRTRREDVAAVS